MTATLKIHVIMFEDLFLLFADLALLMLQSSKMIKKLEDLTSKILVKNVLFTKQKECTFQSLSDQ